MRGVRTEGAVTLHTMFGVLCIYLLIGMLFSSAYALVGDAQSEPFFGSGIDPDISDYLYFSFATMTTVGYGDLAAATDLGRSVAITEALIGQIYLVTVVAVIVGSLSRRQPERASGALGLQRGAGILCLMAGDTTRLRIALAQVNPTVGDIEGNAELISTWIARAREAGAQLVVFPEQTVTGYPAEDLWLKPHFLDGRRRGRRRDRVRGRGNRRVGRLSRARCRHLQLRRGARGWPRRRRLPEDPAPQLRRLRRAPLLRAGRHARADRDRGGPRRVDDLRGHLVSGPARLGGGARRREPDRQPLRLAVSPRPGRISRATGAGAGPRDRGRPLRSATWSAARTSWCSTGTASWSRRRAKRWLAPPSSSRSS